MAQGKADGDGNTRANHSRSKGADGIVDRAFAFADGDDDLVQESVLTNGVQDCAHQQSAEQALGHSAQSVNAIALEGEDNVLSLEKFL